MTSNSIKSLLKTTVNDDPLFVDCISKIFDSLISKYESLPVLGIIHIDNWFDRKWLGFEGKELGAVAVRWNYPYNIPPFHPNRVVSQSIYQCRDDRSYEEVNAPPLHVLQKSTDNFKRKLFEKDKSAIYAWWSSESLSNSRASLMIYAQYEESNEAWFASFERKDSWELTATNRVARKYVLDLMGGADPD